MLSGQAVFNTVATHLFKQGRKAVQLHEGDEEASCSYRTNDGLSCAVGCLISDEEYTRISDQIEGCGVLHVAGVIPRFKPVQDLLLSLQMVHDDWKVNEDDVHEYAEGSSGYWKSTSKMRAALQTVGDAFELDTSILATLSFGDR